MKILYVITTTDLGGAEKALVGLVSHLSKKNKIKVVSLKPLGSVAAELRRAGAEVVSLNVTNFLPFGIVKKLQAEILAFKPDIVHSMLLRGIEFARLACAGKGIKLLTTPHFDWAKQPFFIRFIDRMLKDLDTLSIAESFSTARYLTEKQYYRKDRVFLLPNGADKTVFFRDEALRQEMRKQYGYTPENTVFISVARLDPVKNPMVLLQSFRNIWRGNSLARLVYVGEGNEYAKLKSFIQESGMQESVYLAGKQENINAWLNMSDVFVLVSKEESLPLSLLEALRVGLPCIVSKVGDMPLWVEHGKNGFVCAPGDITLLSCFLTECLSAERRTKMGEESVKMADKITDTFPQYQHLYQQVLMNSFHVKTDPEQK